MRRQISALTLLCLVTAAAAGAERLPIRGYTTADGLVDERIKCIVPDSRGFIWFCGPSGLSRFDGRAFTTYHVPDDLSPNSINDFLETSHGVYWVATNGRGVYRFSPVVSGPPRQRGRGAAWIENVNAARFAVFPVGDDQSANRVNVLYEDRAGRLWAGTDGGLFSLEQGPEPATFQRIALSLPARPDRAVQVWAFAEDQAGTLWIGTSWGLVQRRPDGRILHTAVQSAQGTDHVRALLADRENRIWIGHDTGLFVYCPAHSDASITRLRVVSHETDALTPVRLPGTPGGAAKFTPEDGVSGGVIRALLQSADGEVWIGTWNGVTHFDGHRFRSIAGAQGIRNALALAEDLDGNIWIGMSATGALRVARHGFSTYTSVDGLADPAIGTVFESRAGELFVVSSNQRPHQFDGNRFIAVRPNLVADKADPVGPGSLLHDRAGEWWIPGGAGLYRFPRVNHVKELGRIRPKAIYTTRDGLAGNDVFRLFEDSRGDIWIGRRAPTSEVLTRWERATNTFHRYSEADNLPPFSRITAIAEDQAGNVWIGFQNGGLARHRDGRFTQFSSADGAPGAGIGVLFVDARGRLWIGSARPGLSLVESPTSDRPQIFPYSSVAALSGAIVGCIAEDRMGRLYLGTSAGRIDRLEPETGRVRHYTKADGLIGADLTAAFRDRSGNLWFGSYNGLFRLVPGQDRQSPPPSILIHSVRVAGEPYVTADLGQRQIPRFALGSTQSRVQIEFFGLGGGAHDGLKYQYRLEGVDTDWNVPTDRRDVNYASLSPGTYRFVVRTVGADGAFSPDPATVEFTVLRPIWQRWWFQSAGALALILIGVVAHSHRVGRLVALERVRMRIAADLHDDIGGSLSRISIQSEVACREVTAAGDQPVRRLAEIAESSRRLVDALGDVVWSVDPRKDDVASVLRRIRGYADDLLPPTGVRWTCHTAANLDALRLDPEARRHLFLLLKEAVTNIARHAHARSVSLTVERTHTELLLKLCDDGAGFDAGATRGRTSERRGLTSMQSRALRLGARLIVDSAPGKGTSLSLHLPLRQSWRRMTMLLPTRLR
jgi:ligand-binding sensor domain-containing protein/two-component sensor histidine kinase